MGRPKALLPAGGGTLMTWILDALTPAFEEVLISAGDPALVPPGLEWARIADGHPGAGPLAGLEAGLRSAAHDTVFAVACDLPYVTAALARLLVAAAAGRDAAVPRVGGVPQPVCAAYRRSATVAITSSLDQGRRSIRGVLDGLDVRYVDEPELGRAGIGQDAFWSLDTPADHARFLARLGSRASPGGGNA